LIYIYFTTFQAEIPAAVPVVLKSIQAAQTLKRKIPKLKKLLRLLAIVVKDVVRKIQKTDLTTIIIEITKILKIAEIVKITKIIKDLRIIKIIIKIIVATEITKIATTKDQVLVQVITTTAAVAVVAVTKSLTKKTDLIEIGITKIIEDQDQITDPPLTVISMTNQRKTNRGLQKRRLKLKKTTENLSRPVLEVCSALTCLPKKLSKPQNHRRVVVQAANNRQKLPFLPHQVL
jgi:hypothetical protein